MARLLLLTAAELTRDPRARRQVAAARRLGFEPVGLSGRISGEPPLALAGIDVHRVGPGSRRPPYGIAAARLGEGRRYGPLRRELLGVYRLARLLVRTPRLVRGGRRLGRFDVVHANDLETLPAGYLLAWRSRTRLVYDAHELYTEFETDPPRGYRRLAAAVEGALARRAASVVSVSPELADELRVRLRLPRTPLVVLNAPELSLDEPPAPAGSAVRVIYQGWIGPGRSLDDLFEVARRAERFQLTVRLIRIDEEELDAAARAAGVDRRVTIASPVSPDQTVNALHGFDIGLVIDRPVTRNAELSLPNRLFEYLMAGLAVVVPRLPALTALVEREEVGVTFPPGDTVALAQVLDELAGDRPRLARLRRRAREVAVERYNAEAQDPVLQRAWTGRD